MSDKDSAEIKLEHTTDDYLREPRRLDEQRKR